MEESINGRTWVLALEAPSLSPVKLNRARKAKSYPEVMDHTDSAVGGSNSGGAGAGVVGASGDNGVASSQNPSKKRRGRPLSTGRKQQQEASDSAAVGGDNGVSSENPSKKACRRSPSSEKKQQQETLVVGHTDFAVGGSDSGGAGDNGGACVASDNGVASSQNPSKKRRGRPSGTGKKQQQEASGVVGFGFIPHLITVNPGEDIASMIMTFLLQVPQAVCILSATGVICNVTLRQPSMDSGSVTYEGLFEIISLSGSFLLSEINGSRRRKGCLSVSVAGPDGRVLGGGVAGMLMAATPVQVVVASFIAEEEKPKSEAPSSIPPPNMLNFGATVTEASSPSPGASSDSSDKNGGSPLSHERLPFGNVSQPMHGMPTTY